MKMQSLTMKITALAFFGVISVGVLLWLGGGFVERTLRDLIALRQEQRQALSDLQGPQEAYRRSLEQDLEQVASLQEQGLENLFLEENDVLSFILTVEDIALQTGVQHEINDRGFVEMPIPRRRSSGNQPILVRLADGSEEAVIEEREFRSLRDVPAREFSISLTGSFPAVMRFAGLLEESLPLVLVQTFNIRTGADHGNDDGASSIPSLNDGSIAVSAQIQIHVFLDADM